MQRVPDNQPGNLIGQHRIVPGGHVPQTGDDIDLDNKYIVLDTSGMPDDLLLPGIFWATDVANDLIMDAGGDLSALIADELWSLVGANSNPLAAGFVQEMVISGPADRWARW
mgnify:CR=1 FL=1